MLKFLERLVRTAKGRKVKKKWVMQGGNIVSNREVFTVLC